MAPRKGDTLETAEAGSSQARPRNPNLIPSREESPSAENKRQVSQDKAKVFKEGAERYMAASKLKHEIEYLCETLALYDDLMELQNHLPMWDLPARPFFERLRLAIVGVNQAALDLRSFGKPQGDFENDLDSTAKSIRNLERKWTKMDGSGCRGDVLGQRMSERDMTLKILTRETDSDHIEVLLDTVGHALKSWLGVGQQEMESRANMAKDQWKTKSKNDAQEVAAAIGR